MDVSRLLPRGGAINVDTHQRAEQERQALAAVAAWGSECLGHDERDASALQKRTLSAFDGGASAERVVGDIATQVEVGGKPSLAGFASIVFTQAMDQTVPSYSAKASKSVGSARVR